MRTKKQNMVFLATLSLYATTSAPAQVQLVHLQQLVELSARRLVVAEPVALTKWDSGAAVEDASREDHLTVNHKAVAMKQSENNFRVADDTSRTPMHYTCRQTQGFAGQLASWKKVPSAVAAPNQQFS
jgi:chorismate mutase